MCPRSTRPSIIPGLAAPSGATKTLIATLTAFVCSRYKKDTNFDRRSSNGDYFVDRSGTDCGRVGEADHARARSGRDHRDHSDRDRRSHCGRLPVQSFRWWWCEWPESRLDHRRGHRGPGSAVPLPDVRGTPRLHLVLTSFASWSGPACTIVRAGFFCYLKPAV